jgi:integrase
MAKLKPKAPKAETRALSNDEVGRLLAAVANSPYETLVRIALATGARRGELLGAKWDDVDFARGTLAIRRSLEETMDNGVAEKLPKSGKARVVQMPESAVESLRTYRVAQGRIGPGYVFPGPEGGPWSPNDVGDGFRRYVKRARIGRASLHTLRHTCATMLLAAGVHPKVVQEMLGHSTIAITMDLYSHVTPSL